MNSIFPPTPPISLGQLTAPSYWFNAEVVEKDWHVPSMMFARNNLHLPLFISAIYIFVIFSIKRHMEDKKAYRLNFLFGCWNAALAIFSILGFYRTLPLWLGNVFGPGKSLVYEMCTSDLETGSVWIYLFILSKVPELGDTVFLVMRKSNLIFLHWFHHFLTHINSWMAWGYVHEVGGSFAVMNFGVHSLMYTYFALTSFTRIRFPKWMRMMITGLQILQMAGGLACIVIHHYNCSNPETHHYVLFSYFMYLSYFYLFSMMFVKSYFPSTPSSSSSSSASVKAGSASPTYFFPKDKSLVEVHNHAQQQAPASATSSRNKADKVE